MQISKDILNTLIDKILEDVKYATGHYTATGKEDKPKVINIHTDVNSAASNIYVRTKGVAFKENKVDYKLIDAGDTSLGSICEMIRMFNEDESVTSIIVQLPLREDIREHTDYILNLIKPEKDIDRLTKHYAYSKEVDDLPVTSSVMYSILSKLYKEYLVPQGHQNIKAIPIAFMGNGMTTNKRLVTFMDELGMNTRMINSKTSHEVVKEILRDAKIIFSAVGVTGALNINENKHGEIFVISPTIDCKKTDLCIETHLEKDSGLLIHHHNTFNKIGKLTVASLVLRAHMDAERITLYKKYR